MIATSGCTVSILEILNTNYKYLIINKSHNYKFGSQACMAVVLNDDASTLLVTVIVMLQIIISITR